MHMTVISVTDISLLYFLPDANSSTREIVVAVPAGHELVFHIFKNCGRVILRWGFLRAMTPGSSSLPI